MLHATSRSQRAMPAVAVGLLMLIAALDVVTPLGYAVWALYLLPISLMLFQPRLDAPFWVAAVASALTLMGYLLSPPGIAAKFAEVNRTLGVVIDWIAAGIIWQVLTTRSLAQRLLWVNQGVNEVAQALLGEQTPRQIAAHAVQVLCRRMDAEVGLVYERDRDRLRYLGGNAGEDAVQANVPVGAGLLGQVVLDDRPRAVVGVDAAHVPIASAQGRSAARSVLLSPLRADDGVIGAMEFGMLRAGVGFEAELALLDQCARKIGMALRSAHYRQRQAELLEETRRQSEELQAQQEELRVANEELEEQGRILSDSQAQLEMQHTEMEERNALLEQNQRDLVEAQAELRRYTARLETASRYKSEFLANMSHELRTPLNSALILSQLLAENKGGTLTDEQVKYARSIHESNNDLLALISDILDLSKIEAGHVELAIAPVKVGDVVERMRDTFMPMVTQKGLAFRMDVADGAPTTLHTDGQRLQQILKNLLVNAIKFTDSGEVSMRVEADGPANVRFSVCDTGVGIAREQQEIIFDAFRQADGSTSRRHGGTGLGLSISRELARRMGGDVQVDSEPGRGSCFSLVLPVALGSFMGRPQQDARAPVQAMTHGAVGAPVPAWGLAAAASRVTSDADAGATFAPRSPVAPVAVPIAAQVATSLAAPSAVSDDRHRRNHDGRLILAVEDEPAFGQALVALAHDMEFDCIVAPTATEALDMARTLQPSGILLDIKLPDFSGLTVLEILKRDPATRHVPVHLLSALDRSRTGLEMGAIGHLMKPATQEAISGAIGKIEARLQRTVQRLLIVEDDATMRDSLRELLRADGLNITAVGTVADAMAQLTAVTFDCMVTDLALPDGSGYDLLERMAANEAVAFPPVIVYTGRALSREEEHRLRRYSNSIIVKGARSPERLLDEVTLFLHSVEASLPAERQRMLRQALRRDSVLDGRRILLAEDDVRNIFALSSVLEPLGARLEIARNGREAIERLEATDIDLVLMDIMMPEMDGITAMQRIRERIEWRSLPIIALTAKAMPDDRQRCLEAGANDYIAKPLDIDKLVSLCRVWCLR